MFLIWLLFSLCLCDLVGYLYFQRVPRVVLDVACVLCSVSRERLWSSPLVIRLEEAVHLCRCDLPFSSQLRDTLVLVCSGLDHPASWTTPLIWRLSCSESSLCYELLWVCALQEGHVAPPTGAWPTSHWWWRQAWASNGQDFSLLCSLCGEVEILLKCCGPSSWVGGVVRWPLLLTGIRTGGKGGSLLLVSKNANKQWGKMTSPSWLQVWVGGEEREVSRVVPGLSVPLYFLFFHMEIQKQFAKLSLLLLSAAPSTHEVLSHLVHWGQVPTSPVSASAISLSYLLFWCGLAWSLLFSWASCCEFPMALSLVSIFSPF